MDPRIRAIGRRLSRVGRIVAVTGGKGGIGKSLVASTLALALSRRGVRTGLLDLDLTGPCDHVFLGIREGFPRESFGLEPPTFHGVRFMSIAYFIGERPAPLRGTDVSNALIELLTITQWKDLDVLVVDMPPGLGDATLDARRFLGRAEYLVIATASPVVLETVRRTLRLLLGLRSRILGVVENMGRGDPGPVRSLAREAGVAFLGSLPFDETVEGATGDADRLARTRVAEALSAVASTLHPEPRKD